MTLFSFASRIAPVLGSFFLKWRTLVVCIALAGLLCPLSQAFASTGAGFVLAGREGLGMLVCDAGIKSYRRNKRSGESTLPAVRERHIERIARLNLPDILLSYPSFGNVEIDRDIEEWSMHVARRFEEDFGTLDLEEAPFTSQERKALSGSYRVSYPSPDAVSVVFEMWYYTGAPFVSQDVITLNYSFLSGQRLGLMDVFEDLPRALEILSMESRMALARSIGGGRVDGMIVEGTRPVTENFSCFELTEKGVRMWFQVCQVARPEAGMQSVDIPLESLADARPLLRLWKR